MFVAGALIVSPSGVTAQEEAPTETEATERTTVEDVLSDLVADGVITQDQADAVAEALRENVTRHHHHPGPRGIPFDLEEKLGVSAEELREALADGQTIAEIAAANGADLDALVAETLEAVEDRLDQAVDSGRLSAEEAAEKLAEIEDRIEDLVERDLSDIGRRFRFGLGGHDRGFTNPGTGDAA